MAEIQYKLEIFEGPLDLLLYLVSKHKLNIHDISISKLIEQYLEYIDKAAEQDMEVAGEFLEMAARLIYIKTVSLLPAKEEVEALKRELEGKLIEYSLCKAAAEELRSLYVGGVVFVRPPMTFEWDTTYTFTHDPSVLLESYKNFSIKEQERKPLAANTFSQLVSKRFVSVTSKILYVLRRLYTGNEVEIESLYRHMKERSERVATFLAVLELTKSGRVVINETGDRISFHRKNVGGPFADGVSENQDSDSFEGAFDLEMDAVASQFDIEEESDHVGSGEPEPG